MEFEEREGVFDKSNRVYDDNGISPTLTSTSASQEKILVNKEEIILGGDFRYDEGFRWRENQKSPSLMARAREDVSGQPLIRKVEQINP